MSIGRCARFREARGHAGLGHGALVVPLLVAGTPYLEASNLPYEMRGLEQLQAIDLSPRHWDADVALLCLYLLGARQTIGTSQGSPSGWLRQERDGHYNHHRPTEMLMTRRHSLPLTLAATSLVIVACGASAPTKPEATAVLSGAIESTTLARTLPSAVYCMTANPDFSFATMGQVDFVEMFQNLKDKDPLRDAATAGVVRVELKEFRFDPAGRSPDPSCDAVHAQSKQSGYTSGQVRLAMVRTTLTAKGMAAGVKFDTPLEVATREVVDVIDVRSERGGIAVKYTWRWKPTKMAEAIGYTPAKPQEATARLRRSDDGWVVTDAGAK